MRTPESVLDSPDNLHRLLAASHEAGLARVSKVANGNIQSDVK
jgi:hypothetical protein